MYPMKIGFPFTGVIQLTVNTFAVVEVKCKVVEVCKPLYKIKYELKKRKEKMD